MKKLINIIIVVMLLMAASESITKSSALSMEMHNIIYLTTSREQALAISYIKMANPAAQTYFFIDKYCEMYSVPKKIASNVARLETGYKGPMKKYNPYQVSYSNAYGAMQVIYPTAQEVWRDDPVMYEKLSVNRLVYDLDYNIHTGVKYLSMLHSKYGNWMIVLGFYNTGHVGINEYALQGTK